MALLPILEFPDPRLRTKGALVDPACSSRAVCRTAAIGCVWPMIGKEIALQRMSIKREQLSL